MRMRCGNWGVVNMAEQSFHELLATARGHFVWPEDAVLYCLSPERELLPDKVKRICFQAYLHLCNLPYTCKVVCNADYMSPDNHAPLLCVKIGSHPTVFSDFDKLVAFLEAQQLGLDSNLQETEKANKEAFISLIRKKLSLAEDYQTWINTRNTKQYTLRTHGWGLAWPLNVLVPFLHQVEFSWDHWELFRAKPETILFDFEHACSTLSTRLGTGQTFFSCGPTTLDVMVYSHFQAILTTVLPSQELAKIALQYQNLVQFCRATMPAQGLQL